jgi:hypothetical protein
MRIPMGKLKDSTTLVVREPSLVIKPIAGWSWYCGYHDTYGIGDDEDEVLFMAGAHMYSSIFYSAKEIVLPTNLK